MGERKEYILSPRAGLNQDDSVLTPPLGEDGRSAFEVGDYRWAKNVRIGSSVEDNIGAVENIPSTLLVNNYWVWNGSAWVSSTAPSGTSKSRGKFEDKDEGKIYEAVYNSGGNHMILMWVKSERKIYELLKWSGLAFDANAHIAITKINKYLVLVDKINPNRIIDTSNVFSFKQTLGSSFSEYHISFAKWAPVAPIVVNVSVKADGKKYLERGLYQFTYRYIYKGGFRSTFAPPTKFFSQEFETDNYSVQQEYYTLKIMGFLFDYDTPGNTSFEHTSIKFYEFVDYIEIAYRQSTKDNWGLWKRFAVDKVTPANNQSFLFGFDSIPSVSTIIPSHVSGQYFDSVPLKSGAVEAIDNRVVFADNEDEFPAVEGFDVTDVAVYTTQGGDNNLNWYRNNGYSGIPSDAGQLFLNNRCSRYSFKERGIYKAGIIFQHPSGRTNLVTTIDKWTYNIPTSQAASPVLSESMHALGFKIAPSVTPPDWAVAYQIVRTNALNFEFFIQGIVEDFVFLQNDNNSITDDIQTPSGVKTAINEFYDNYNDAGANQFPLYSRILGEIRKNKVNSDSSLSGYIYMDISNWFLSNKGNAAGSFDNPANNLFYSFRQGDKVRFWGSESTSYLYTTQVPFEEEIVAFTGQGIICRRPPTLVTMKNRSGTGTNGGVILVQGYQIEIFREKNVNKGNVVFHECSEWYPITSPGTPSRDFSKRDFTYSGNANVSKTAINGYNVFHKYPITAGDVFMVKKKFYYNYRSVIHTGLVSNWFWAQMTQRPTDAPGFWERETRPLVAHNDLPINTDKPTQARFGGRFFEDGALILINNFRDEWQHTYPSDYGRIRALVNTSNAQVESVGNILLAIGEQESWSIYINRTTLEDLSGETQVAISDKVLGSFNTLLGSHGTLNPESISKESGRVLFWNARRGIWVRYSRDGLTPVSERKMKNWFKDLGDLLIGQYTNTIKPRVISSFDDYHERWITDINHSTLPATFKGYDVYKCSTFSEADGRWKEFFDHSADLFAGLDNEVYSLVGTTVIIHEEGSDYGSFNGVKKDSEIELVANPELMRKKIWMAQGHIASDKWSFPSIKGDWKSNGTDIQETNIGLGRLSVKEDMYWADISRDINTPNKSGDDARANGDVMRSRSLKLRMRLDPDVDYLSVFNWLALEYTLSEKTVKS